ncbi:MAG TPA: PepSY-associated TM helix domain-containing protein [Edaphobacter sp.]|nr:PepSY-associated TM helix domain-containing protein [Edaphobacter sp.]
MMRLWHRLLHTPRQTLARRVMFQFHLWCGVIVGLYVALIGLSGSALVFRPELESAMRPALYALQPLSQPVQQATLDEMLHTAAKAFPEWKPMGFDQLPAGPGAVPTQPVVLYMMAQPGREISAPHSFTPDQLLVYLDPRTGALLGARSRYAGVLGLAENFHYYLLAGQRGYIVNGILGVAFLGLALTGWVLWWPGIRRVVGGLKIHGLWRGHYHHGHRNWKRLNWDLHSTGGFWSNPALIAIIVTGIFFIFPQPMLRGFAWLTHTDPSVIRQWYSGPGNVTASAGAKPVTAQAAWTAAAAALPENAHVGYFALPAEPGAAYEGIAYYDHTAPYAQPLQVYINPFTAEPIERLDSRTLPLAMRAVLYVYAVHFGNFAGLASRVLWFLLGLMPAVLLVSGLIMWWNRSLRRRFAQKTSTTTAD